MALALLLPWLARWASVTLTVNYALLLGGAAAGFVILRKGVGDELAAGASAALLLSPAVLWPAAHGESWLILAVVFSFCAAAAALARPRFYVFAGFLGAAAFCLTLRHITLAAAPRRLGDTILNNLFTFWPHILVGLPVVLLAAARFKEGYEAMGRLYGTLFVFWGTAVFAAGFILPADAGCSYELSARFAPVGGIAACWVVASRPPRRWEVLAAIAATAIFTTTGFILVSVASGVINFPAAMAAGKPAFLFPR